MDLFDAFFLTMVFLTGIGAFLVVGVDFFKRAVHQIELNLAYRRADKNSFKFDRATGPMAVRNQRR